MSVRLTLKALLRIAPGTTTEASPGWPGNPFRMNHGAAPRTDENFIQARYAIGILLISPAAAGDRHYSVCEP